MDEKQEARVIALACSEPPAGRARWTLELLTQEVLKDGIVTHLSPETVRLLQYYLNLGFRNGFVLDGFEEHAFPPDHPQTSPLGWGGKFSEIPPVLIARFCLK